MRCRIINNTLNNLNICVCGISQQNFFNIISGEVAIVQYPRENREKFFGQAWYYDPISVPLASSHHLFLSFSQWSTRVRNPLNFQWAEDSTISGRRSRGLNSGNKFANKFLRKFATSRESSSENFGASSVAISFRYSLGQNLFYLRKE